MKLKQVTEKELKHGVEYFVEFHDCYFVGRYDDTLRQICGYNVENCNIYKIIPESRFIIKISNVLPLTYEVRLRNNNLMAAFCRSEDCLKYLDMIEPGIEHKV